MRRTSAECRTLGNLTERFLCPRMSRGSFSPRPPDSIGAAHDDHLERREMKMDFLGTPYMNYEVGGRRFEADENGIIAGVPPGNYSALLNMGCCPLPPVGWVDPRPVTVK